MKQIQKIRSPEPDQMLPVRLGYCLVQPQPQLGHVVLGESCVQKLHMSVQQRLADHGKHEHPQNACQLHIAGHIRQKPVQHCPTAAGLYVKALQQRHQQQYADAPGQGHQDGQQYHPHKPPGLGTVNVPEQGKHGTPPFSTGHPAASEYGFPHSQGCRWCHNPH
ncbi:unknown [Ruminococcus sp. CAG:379]|nr:unknown [Ruminococcus sp. CAG:379]